MSYFTEVKIPSSVGVQDFINKANDKLKEVNFSLNTSEAEISICIEAEDYVQVFRSGMLVGAFLEQQLQQAITSIKNLPSEKTKP